MSSGPPRGPPSAFPFSGREPPFGRPPRQQQDATAMASVAVATSPPSVTDATEDDDNGAATPTSESGGGQLVSAATAASFVYPPEDGLRVNYVDRVVVGWETVWKGVKMSASCNGGEESVEGEVVEFDVESASGTFTMPPIGEMVSATRYPVACTLVLEDVDSAGSYLFGPVLEVVSTSGVASLYAQSTTSVLEASSTESSSTASDSTSATSTASTTAAVGAEASNTTLPDSASSSGGDDAGVSSGTKAGIAIGVILGVGLLLAAIFFMHRRHWRKVGMDSEKVEAADQARPQHSEKTHPSAAAMGASTAWKTTNPPSVARKPVGEGARPATSRKDQGEWKQFFSARAQSPMAWPVEALPVVPGAGSEARISDVGSTTGLVRR